MGSNVLGDSKAFELQNPVAVTSTANGTSIDLRGGNYEDGVAIMNIGAVSGTSPTLNTKIQDSADDSTFADYKEPGSSTVATFTEKTATGGPFRLPLNMRGMRRYMRIVNTLGGSSPSFLMDVILLAKPKEQPADAQA